MANIRLENINLEYRGKQVLKDINLTVEDQEMCTLVGPSGCGKSLILRIMAGLIKPSSGNVYIDDQLANNVPPGDRNIAMVFQGFALYPYMTVRENWAFPLRASKLPEAEIVALIREVSDLLQMDPLLERLPRQLSGGQQQRAALGRALVRRPTMFLMDEPLSAQDAKRRVELATALKKIQMDLGITTVIVTSDQLEAQALGDKLAVMDTGALKQVGTPEEIYNRPANLFVAGFIGSPAMNFFDCTLTREGQRFCITNHDLSLTLPDEAAAALESRAPGDALVVGIRPEHIHVTAQEAPETIAGQVYVIEPQSNELLIDVQVGETIVRMRIDRDDLAFEPRLDQTVFLDFDKNMLHLFDSQTSHRIN